MLLGTKQQELFLLRAIKTKKQIVSTELSPVKLVDNYNEQIYKFCCKLTYSKEDAEDLFQETLTAKIIFNYKLCNGIRNGE